MSTTEALIKANPLLPAEDFNELRKKGFKHIENLGSAVWTDYNNSDPGITLLDAVSYAITDLAYRTGFEVKDLLAPEQLTPDTWKNIFYTARQILHNSALTISDYRKLIIDVAGVRNAWVMPSKDYEVPLWMNYNFLERKEGNDCSCTDTAHKICYGKLQLKPATPEEVQESKDTAYNKIDERIEALKEKIRELEAQREPTIEAIGETEVGADSKRSDTAKNDKIQAQIDVYSNTISRLEKYRLALENLPYIPSKIVELEGLYNVMVEYEEDVLEDEIREEIRQKVQERLYEHRNLGEDFLSVNAVEYEDIGISASIALEDNADPDEVLAQIFFTIHTYFSPSVPFYTIDQLMERGMQVDHIFEGPALQHGFIVSEELEATSLYRDIRLSDIINAVMDIPGIKAVTFLQLPFMMGIEDREMQGRYFNKWVKELQYQQKIARLIPEKSAVIFCKDRDFISYNTGTSTDRRPQRMLKLFNDLKTLERTYKLKGTSLDFPVPYGENMELEDYYPVTETLPLCYGVSERAGLPAAADAKRQTQALQLKGYLLFFEQLLGDYLVQLNHVKDLFSFDPAIERTYFSKPLLQIQGLQDLIIDHNNHGAAHWEDILKDFSEVLGQIIETPRTFLSRRNTFLDHLLARFAENLEEYEKIARWLIPEQVDERLIRDKANILAHGEYYHISSERGTGYNYALPDYWNTDNVSGTERRVSRLLGFQNIKRRFLVPSFICVEPVMEMEGKKESDTQKTNAKGQPLNHIRFIDPDKKKTLLTSIEVPEGCCTQKLLEEILKFIDQKEYFHFHDELKPRARKTAGKVGKFSYELWDALDEEIAITLAISPQFSKMEDRKMAFERLQELIWQLNNNEGFHLVEHLLLRPKFDEVLDEVGEVTPVALLDTCLDPCDIGKGLEETEKPKYRKRISRVPAARCFDQMPWVLEYLRWNKDTKKFDLSALFQKVDPESHQTEPLKFRKYEQLVDRIQDIQQYGAERINYQIVVGLDPDTQKEKYGFILRGEDGVQLAQSPFVFNKKKEDEVTIEWDIEEEITHFMEEFGYELDLYCEENPCDHNEDPYSFRATAVFPCWPKRFKDPTFRGLVERTLQRESPAHMHITVKWVGINEMMKFEEVYCDWLAELYETEIPSYDVVNPLVRALNTIKSCGSCDCEEECQGSQPKQEKLEQTQKMY